MTRPSRRPKPREFFEGGKEPATKSRQSKPGKVDTKLTKTSKKNASKAKRVVTPPPATPMTNSLVYLIHMVCEIPS